MTKEELMILKRKLESKYYEYDYASTNGLMSEYEIMEEIDNEGAVQNIENYFEAVMKYYSTNNVPYTEIVLHLHSYIYVSEKSFDENDELKEKVEILPDIAMMDATFMCKNNEEIFGQDPSEIYPEDKGFIVQMSKFKELLKDRGYELENVTSTEEIKELVLADRPAISRISLRFEKENKKNRQRIKD